MDKQMIELVYKIDIQDYIIFINECYWLTKLCNSILIPKKALNGKKQRIYNSLIGINMFIFLRIKRMLSLDDLSHFQEIVVINIIVDIMFIILNMKLLYKPNKPVHTYLAITFIAVERLIYFITNCILEIFSKSLIEILDKLSATRFFSSNQEKMQILMNIKSLGDIIIYLLSYSIIIGIIYYWIMKKLSVIKKPLEKREIFLLETPSIAALVVGCILRMIFVLYYNGQSSLIYEQLPFMLVLIPLLCSFMLVMIIVTIHLFQSMLRLHEEEKNRIIMENQMANMQEHLVSVEHLYEGIRGLKHDMRNHISNMKGLIRTLNIDDNSLDKYISSLDDTLNQLELEVLTGNPITDVLINQKCHEMKERDIDYEVNFKYPSHLAIDIFDMSIILDNGIDNALEACEKVNSNHKKFIKINCTLKKNMFFINIENSFNGKEIISNISELPRSTKGDICAHGFGLNNIKSCAQKYNGDIDVYTKNNVFYLNVIVKG